MLFGVLKERPRTELPPEQIDLASGVILHIDSYDLHGNRCFDENELVGPAV
jgi:hypothetical protein